MSPLFVDLLVRVFFTVLPPKFDKEAIGLMAHSRVFRMRGRVDFK